MQKSRFTPDAVAKVVQQRLAGAPVLELCCENKISTSTLYNWIKRAKASNVNSSSDIALQSQPLDRPIASSKKCSQSPYGDYPSIVS